VRIPYFCSHDPATVVLAHLGGAGMGIKSPDIHGAFACSDCHDILDGRKPSGYTKEQLRLMHLDGVIRTQEIWLKEGLM